MTEENKIIDSESTQAEEPSIAHDSSWATRLSRALSWLLHPFVVPLYVMVFMLFFHSNLSHFSAEIKSFLAWTVVLYAAVVPMISLGLLRLWGLIKDFGLHSQRARVIPLLVGTISYVMGAMSLRDFPMATVLCKFMMAAACCEALALIVTPFWKISLHSICMGGVTALFMLLSVAGAGQHFWALVAAILLSGALASARLHLGAHKPSQVAAGYFGGMVVAMLAIMYL